MPSRGRRKTGIHLFGKVMLEEEEPACWRRGDKGEGIPEQAKNNAN